MLVSSHTTHGSAAKTPVPVTSAAESVGVAVSVACAVSLTALSVAVLLVSLEVLREIQEIRMVLSWKNADRILTYSRSFQMGRYWPVSPT